MTYLGYFRYDGIEIANEVRLSAYTDAMRLGWFQCDGYCPTLAEAVEMKGWRKNIPFQRPASDAPWYDPNTPDSAEFAGVHILDATNLHNSTYQASAEEGIYDGGYVQPGRRHTREMVFRALLIGSSAAGAHYGLSWLTTVLMEGNACRRGLKVGHNYKDIADYWLIYKRTGTVLPDNLYQAPLVTGHPHTYSGLRQALNTLIPLAAPDPNSSDVVPIENLRECLGKRLDFSVVCPEPEALLAPWRYMMDVHLMSAPTVLSEHVLSGAGCDAGSWIEVEFTLVAGNPGVWHEPIDVREIQKSFNYATLLPDPAAVPPKTWWSFYKELTSIPADDDVFQAPLVAGRPHTYGGFITTLWNKVAAESVTAVARSAPVVPSPAAIATTGSRIIDPMCPIPAAPPPIPQTLEFLCTPIYEGATTRLTYSATASKLPKYLPLALKMSIAAEDVDVRDIRVKLVPELSGVQKQEVLDFIITYLPSNSVMLIDSIMRRVDVLRSPGGGQMPEWTSGGHLVMNNPSGTAFNFDEILCAGDFSVVLDIPAAYDVSMIQFNMDVVPRDV